MLQRCLLTILSALAAVSVHAQSVALSGVAGGKALLTVDASAPRFLSPGQTHRGVKLLATQGDTATVEVNGQKQMLRLGEAPVNVGGAAALSASAQRAVLTADAQGHFTPAGQINGRAVQFLVDTGASQVILSATDARRINLPFEQGQPVRVSTANGNATGYSVRLSSVKVGDVQAYDVAAIVLPQAMPYVLLGNSFLTRFQMQRTNDQLTLEKR